MSDVHVVDQKRLSEENILIRIEGARWERLRKIEKALEDSGLTVEELISEASNTKL